MPRTGLTQNELLALTTLLCTPSELHDLWVKKDKFNLPTHMTNLGFSSTAANTAVALMQRPQMDSYTSIFETVANKLRTKEDDDGQFPEYSDGSAHPPTDLARKLVTRLLES